MNKDYEGLLVIAAIVFFDVCIIAIWKLLFGKHHKKREIRKDVVET